MPNRFSLIVASVAICLGQQAAPDILSPAPDSRFSKGPVRVIARAEGKAELLLDGRSIASESPAAGVLLAHVEPAVGVHEIRLKTEKGEQKIRFSVGEGSFAAFREHPPVAKCETCHAVKNGVWSLQRTSPVLLCFQCHNKETFPKTHTHIPGVLADCQMCHNPHGWSTAAFLTMKKEQACKLCHN
ncbi:MAG: hypothetical protein JJE04_17385 [Acidobacteriia bacterium]|nr:hypothetical protein [Terriglobia bacterium]